METAKERVSKPALPCTPAGIRQPNPYKADKETTDMFIVTGYVVPASIRPPSNLTRDNS